MRKYLLMLSLIAVSVFAFGQGNWQNIVATDKVNEVIEANGKLWMATNAGVMSVDKTSLAVKQFTKTKDGLPSDMVEGLAVESNGDLWIGTYEMNLARYNGTTWQTVNYPVSLNLGSDVLTYCVKIDAQDVKWFGTSRGLVRYDGTTWEVFNQSNTGINFLVEVWDIAFGNNGDVYVGSFGVMRYDGVSWTDMSTANGLFTYGGIRLETLKNGDLLFSDLNQKIATLKDSTWTIYTTNIDFPWGEIKGFSEDASGQLFCMIQDTGVFKLHNGAWQHVSTSIQAFMADGDLTTLFHDSNGNTWYGSGANFVQQTANNTLNPLSVNTVVFNTNQLVKSVHTPQNSFLIGNNSLTTYDAANGWAKITTPSFVSFPFQYFKDIVVTEDGDYWVLSAFEKLHHWNGQNWTAPITTSGVVMVDMTWDETNDVLWVASNQIIKRIDGAQTTVFNSTNTPALAVDYVKNMVVAPNGDLYISIGGGKIYVYDGISWTDISPFTITNSIMDMYINSQGDLLIGTWVNGVWKYDGSSWVENPLMTFKTVMSIAEDENGDFYYGTYNDGIYFENSTGLSHFTKENSGLHHNQIKNVSINATGHLWVSTNTGLSIYHPNAIVLSDFDIAPTMDLKLSNFPNPFTTQTTITFELDAPQRVSLYLYDVKGQLVRAVLDNEQRPAGEVRLTLDKAELSSGIYFLELRAGLASDVRKVSVF